MLINITTVSNKMDPRYTRKKERKKERKKSLYTIPHWLYDTDTADTYAMEQTGGFQSNMT